MIESLKFYFSLVTLKKSECDVFIVINGVCKYFVNTSLGLNLVSITRCVRAGRLDVATGLMVAWLID